MPSLGKLEDMADRAALAALVGKERKVSLILKKALDDIRVAMSKIYEKYSVNGVLTKAQMTQYGRMASVEKKILDILNPALAKSARIIKRVPIEAYDDGFFRYAWAIDASQGVRLDYGTLNLDAIQKDLDNVYDKISLVKYGPEARVAVRQAIGQGLATGKSFTKMAKDLKDALNTTAYKALRIIRTEGMTAINSGQDAAYARAVENGIEGQYIWDATLDGRTRPEHGAKDQEVRDETADPPSFRPLDGYRPRYPTDENLSARMRINCIPEYAIPIGFNTEMLFRRWYDGELIVIKTSTGSELSMTPNHPVFSDKGWIEAHLIDETSRILSVRFGKKLDTLDVNINNSPPMASKIFDLFRIVSIEQRATGSNSQFHGDGRDGDIDIETINSHLWNSFQSAFYKPAIQNILTSSYILSGFFSCFSAINKFFFRALHSSHRVMRGLAKICPFFLTRLGHSKIHRTRPIPRIDSAIKQYTADSITRDIEITCKRLFGHSFDVFFDDVIMVNRVPYTGHVYNLQTPVGYYGLYSSNGNMAIVHNCRCRLRFQVAGYAPILRRTRDQGLVPYQTYEEWYKEYG